MTQKVSNTDRYSATPDQMMAMIGDSDYLTEKYTALGDLKFNVDEQTVADGSIKTQISRTVAADLPGVVKKVMGETNDMVQTETWDTSGATKTADVVIDSPGKPIKITAKYAIAPVGDSECDFKVDFEIKASVPLVGGKIEKIVKGETADNFPKERVFNEKWLAEH